MAEARQHSFTAGELAPAYWGRPDLPLYSHGLRVCRNFFISRAGSAVSRPGTLHLRSLGFATTGAGRPRLLKFKYSEGLEYLVAVVPGPGSGVIYVLRNGELKATLPAPYHIPLDMRQLRAAHQGNSLILTHPYMAPQELLREDDTTWSLGEWSTARIDPVYAEPLLVHPGPSGTDAKREWYWKVSQIVQLPTGELRETKAALLFRKNDFTGAYSPVGLSSNEWELKPGDPAEIDFTMQGLGVDQPFAIKAWVVYRGRGDIFGRVPHAVIPWSYSTDPESNRFNDYGDDPIFTEPPKEGRNPFVVEAASGGVVSVLRTEKPIACAYFDGRLVFGGSVERGHWLWASAANDYLDFDKHQFPIATTALEFPLAVREHQEIRALVPGNRLLVFTSGGVWAVGGEAALSGDPADLPPVRLISEQGCSWTDPLPVPGAVLYARGTGTGVRDLAFSAEAGGFTGDDVSLLAQHLLRGNEIRSWTYAEDPWGVVWAVLADGRMASLTYSRERSMAAWAIHDTSWGTFEGVCAVNEGGEDVVYVVTLRNGEYRLEVMASRVIDAPEDAVCLDAAVTYSGTPATEITGLGHLNGRTVNAVADGEIARGLTVASGKVTLPVAASKVTVGLPLTAELELLDLAEAYTKNKRVGKLVVLTEASRGLWAGENADQLVEAPIRRIEDGYAPVPLRTQAVEVQIGSTWNRGGRAFLRQVDPMPLTVVGVVREVS